MQKLMIHTFWAWLIFFILSFPASAHFGMLIPSDSMVMKDDHRTISLNLSFSHPFENIGMKLEKPNQFEVVTNGNKRNLTETLKNISVMDQTAWGCEYRINRPGVYIFYMVPKPYWEPAEDCFIIHYTKTVVAAFGEDDGWDREIGLKTEIVPLSRPFALYQGNIFQGIVKLNGKTVPFAEVEVEYYNQNGKSVALTDYMITQKLKADQNGVFSYAAPKAGWWGFASLNRADFQLKMDGQKKDVELGAVIWVKYHQWK